MGLEATCKTTGKIPVKTTKDDKIILHDRMVAILALQMNYKWLQNQPYFTKGLTDSKFMLVFVEGKNQKIHINKKPRSRAANFTVIKREKWIHVITVTEVTVNLLAKPAPAESTLLCP